jgi:hypothetical protein
MDSYHTHIGSTHGEELWLSATDRRQHTAILGASGNGKSVLLEHMAAQDMARGDGLLLLDVSGLLAETVLTHVPAHRHNQVCVLHVGDVGFPVGLNLLEHTGADRRAVVADAVVSAMRSIWHDSWGPLLEMILSNAVMALLEIPNASLVLVPRLLTDEAFRASVIARVRDPMTLDFFEGQFGKWRDAYREEVVVSTLNKIGAFLRFPHVRNILGQGKSTLHLDKAMERGRIVIVNLSKREIGETAARLMGALLLANVVSKLSLTQKGDFHLLIDEAHNFTGAQSLAVLLQESRKFNTSVTVATQHLAALSEDTRSALLGNAHTLVCFKLATADADLLAPTFNRQFQDFNPYALQHLERGQAIVRDGSGDANTVAIPPPWIGKGKPDIVRRQSRLHYANRREDVERNILKALGHKS